MPASHPESPLAPTIFYDAECAWCRTFAERARAMLGGNGYRLVALQDEEARSVLGLRPGEIPDEMKLRRRDGTIVGGLDALLELARERTLLRLLAAPARIGIVHAALDSAYRSFAERRRCLPAGACRVHLHKKQR